MPFVKCLSTMSAKRVDAYADERQPNSGNYRTRYDAREESAQRLQQESEDHLEYTAYEAGSENCAVCYHAASHRSGYSAHYSYESRTCTHYARQPRSDRSDRPQLHQRDKTGYEHRVLDEMTAFRQSFEAFLGRSRLFLPNGLCRHPGRPER